VPEDTFIIEVDLVNPHGNREVVIFTLSDYEHKDCVLNCFNIFLFADIRDVLKGNYEAELLG